MTSGAVVVALCALILVVLAIRTVGVVRAERGALRGSPPRIGHHRIEAGYWPGGGRGGPNTWARTESISAWAQRPAAIIACSATSR